jgi:hypothetical protein
MRIALSIVILATFAGVASAANWNVTSPFAPDKDRYVGDGGADSREGGEGFGDALVIGALPFSDTGATCDNLDDITLPCAASAAQDVVYSYTAAADGIINVSLCGSEYDTALGIYNSGFANIACNDDFCGLQSEIDGIAMSAGETIYIVVDGFSTSCGSYVINVSRDEPCVLDCPSGALAEGEPDCYDEYFDNYNGGCNSTGWTLVCPQDAASAVMCGTSGTYFYQGGGYRDTDWMLAYGNGGTMTASVRAEFPVQFIFIYGTDCNNLVYDITTANACQDATLSRTVAAGTPVWLWIGASVFDGVPCGSEWVLTVDGLGTGEGCEPTPVLDKSWGEIKGLYR